MRHLKVLPDDEEIAEWDLELELLLGARFLAPERVGDTVHADTPGAKAKAKGKARAAPKKVRAPKYHRLSAHDFIVAVDNILQVITGRGLVSFRDPSVNPLDDKGAMWDFSARAVDPRAYLNEAGRLPRMFFVDADQGSDNSAGVWWAIMSQCLCIVPRWDPSHRIWNDIRLAASKAGLWTFVVLSTVCLNLGHGPWNQKAWYKDMTVTVVRALKTLSHEHPLFQEVLPQICRERGLGAPTDETAQTVFEELRESAGLLNKGSHVSLGRWLDWLKAAEAFLSSWHSRWFILTLMGLRQGHVTSAADLVKLVDVDGMMRRSAGAAPTSEAGRTPTARADASMKALRTATCNSCHLSLVFLSDVFNQNRMSLLVELSKPLHVEYSATRHNVKSNTEVAYYHQNRAAGSELMPLLEIVISLQNLPMLERCGFIIQHPPGIETDDAVADRFEQRELASVAMRYTMALLHIRLRTIMQHVRGWPDTFALVGGGPDWQSRATVERLRGDYGRWLALEGDVDVRGKEWELLEQRSVFRMPSVRCLVAACIIAQWDWKAKEVLDIAQRLRQMSFGGSVLLEDSFQRQRTREQKQSHTGIVSDMAAWLTPLRKQVLDKLYRFDPVPVPDREPQPGEHTQPPVGIYNPKPASCSIPNSSKNLPGTNQTSDWPTWRPVDLCRQVRDLIWTDFAMTDRVPKNAIGQLSRSILAQPGTVMRNDARGLPWSLCIGRLDDLAMFWPLDGSEFRMTLGGGLPRNYIMFKLGKFKDLGELQVIPMFEDNWEGWMAIQTITVAPCEAAYWTGIVQGVCIMQSGIERPLLEHAAIHGFVGIPKTDLNSILEALKQPRQATLWGALMALLDTIMGDRITEERKLIIMEEYWANLDSDDAKLFQCDAYEHTLTKSDKKDVEDFFDFFVFLSIQGSFFYLSMLLELI